MTNPQNGKDHPEGKNRYGHPSHIRVLAFFILALIIRLVPLGQYVTPDEPIWVLRSIRLLEAVKQGQWADIPQTGHPGLTTMVLGALGVQLTSWFMPAASEAHLRYIQDIAWLAPESSPAFPHLAFFLNPSRILVAIICSGAISLIYVTARSRLGEKTSRLLALCLAVDPFFAGLAGLLHTDALQATFIILSILFLLPPQRSNHVTPTLFSGLFLALAGLTKTLGLIIAPGLALTVLLWGRGSLRERITRTAVLTLSTIFFIFILYPPFWVQPVEAFGHLVEAVTYHQGAGLRDVFFAGQLHIDPGPLFYPTVLLFRTSTPVFVGLLSILWRKTHRQRRIIRWLFAPLLIYILTLTLATKKFDRYILTIIPLLTVIAAVAWRSLHTRWHFLFLTMACLPWAMTALIPLYYANPLLGGPWLAQNMIPFGWGEGSGYAAQKLNKIFLAPSEHIVLTNDIPGVASIFKGDVVLKTESNALCADALISRSMAGYAGYETVDTIHIAGMHLTTIYTRTLTLPDIPHLVPGRMPGINQDAIAPATSTPALESWLNEQYSGQLFTWVHARDCSPITEAQLSDLLCPADPESTACSCQPARAVGGFAADLCQFTELTTQHNAYLVKVGEVFDIIAATWAPTINAPGTLDVYVRWSINKPYETITAYLALRDAEHVIWAEGTARLESPDDWLKSSRAPGSVLEGKIQMPLLPSLPPGPYILTVSFTDQNNRGIGLINPDGTFGGIQSDMGAVTIISSPNVQSEAILPLPMEVTLPGYHVRAAMPPPKALYAGDQLPFRLEIARTQQAPSETIEWAVICEGEELLAGDLFGSMVDTDPWEAGHYYELRYAPRTNARASGECQLHLQSGEQVLATIGFFEVIARERSFALPRTPQTATNYQIGSFGHLIGVDISQQEIAAGATLAVTLYWKADRAASLNYTTFIHLVSQDGIVIAQSDALPAQGNAPTTSWVANQIITDAHLIEVKMDTPAGEYTLYTGMYDAQSGYRESVFNSSGEHLTDNQIPIGTILVSD